jgi:acetoin utilization deacetylase AcuC-like enzyme
MKYHVYYGPAYVASDYAFDTTRKAGEIAASIQAGRSRAIVTDPEEFTDRTKELIANLHAPAYVEAVTTGEPSHLAESQGFTWDPKIPTMAVAHSAGLVAAVTEVVTGDARVAGSLSSGLHHARRDCGTGFCTYNGLAVAAQAATDLDAARVLILDFDAHCGGGTRSMTDPKTVVQIEVSTSTFDQWQPAPGDALLLAEPHNYLDRISEALELADQAGTFDLVLYNSGMDPANFGVSSADLERREHMVASWTRQRDLRLVFALAGGYTGRSISMADLVALHTLTIDAFG